MSRVQVEVLSGGGSLAGRRFVLDASPVRFGRDTQNTVVLDTPAVSRFHGELTCDEHGVWSIINYSSNDLQLGRRSVGASPAPLHKPVVVKSGGRALMRITPVADDAPTDATGQPVVAAGTSTLKRAGLWGWIGLCLLAILIALVYPTLTADTPTRVSGLPDRLDDQAIIAEIQGSPEFVSQDPDLAERALNTANADFDRIEMQPEALRSAYENYVRAIRHTPDGVFETGLDQRRYQHVQQQLTERVLGLYDEAYQHARGKRYTRALDSLEDLIDLYPDSDTALGEHLLILRRYCRQRE